jgi:hypothetical protein
MTIGRSLRGEFWTDMDYSQKTANLIERMCRINERTEIPFDKEKILELLQKANDVFGLGKTWERVVVCKDIFEEIFYSSASSALSAPSASSALSALSAWSALSARSASSASSASSAWSASSASSALDYNWDWLIYSFEFNQSNKGNENDLKYLKYEELMMQAKEAGLGHRIEWENILYLVPAPIARMKNNRFHSDQFPAIEWQGASKFYYLNGVNFPESLWKKVVSHEMPFEEILAIVDIDQRTQAMRYGDADKFFKHTKSELLDKSEKGNELWFIPQSAGIFTQDAYFLKYACPSTNRVYMSGIEPKIGEHKNADYAMSWKHNLPTVEEYLSLKAES